MAEFYPNEFSNIDIRALEYQLKNYIFDVQSHEVFVDLQEFDDLSRKLVETEKYFVYPLIYMLLKLILILSIATASVERAFSAMNYVKSRLEN